MLTVIALCVSLAVGSVALPLHSVISALSGGGDSLTRTLVLELRLPRAITAFATGGLLALAGALMQVLLRNPLADPYILGVSGGAAVGALLALLLGLAGFWVSGSAFLGALISMLMVFVLAHGRGGWTPTRLLLTGIVVAFGWGAAISLLLVLSDDASLRSMLFWLMGDLSYRSGGWLPLVVVIAGLAVCLPFARHLNVLARGETLAEALGISVRPFTIAIYIARLAVHRRGRDRSRRHRFRGAGGAAYAALDRPAAITAHLLPGAVLAGRQSTDAGRYPGAQPARAAATAGGRGDRRHRRAVIPVSTESRAGAVMSASPLLETRGLTVSIAGKYVCRDFSLAVHPGVCIGVLGGNGVGKTTCCIALAGLRPADSGGVLLNGVPLKTLPRRRIAQQLGLLMQQQEDSLPATVLETALIGRHPHIDFWRWESHSDVQSHGARSNWWVLTAWNSGPRPSSPAASVGAWRSLPSSPRIRGSSCWTSPRTS